ncbi:hypothetical protein [Methylobacterium sp. J-070]|uniref:hypothetical protein n=1 Tax=Methylobacterium sp. J-070 TaxID=2836650 RepID=UPI001FBAD809|nr:hypothetical protein [Methylobacterium sp. J-070]MCJ2048481.1 hypothetical protein [Methylobacterium sp. J-070]
MRKTLKTTGTAALAAFILTASMPAAQARDGIGVGGAVALGALGGVVAGSAIASANNGYYPGQPVYRAPPPVYVEEVCHVERRGFIDPYGVEHIRRVRVCE